MTTVTYEFMYDDWKVCIKNDENIILDNIYGAYQITKIVGNKGDERESVTTWKNVTDMQVKLIIRQDRKNREGKEKAMREEYDEEKRLEHTGLCPRCHTWCYGSCSIH